MVFNPMSFQQGPSSRSQQVFRTFSHKSPLFCKPTQIPLQTALPPQPLRRTSLAAKQGAVETQEANKFFNRTIEQQFLRDYLLQKPGAILVILGPRSSGKTALIKQLFLLAPSSSPLLAEEDSEPAEISTRFGSYMDGREQELSGSAALASSLQLQGKSLFNRLTDIAKYAGLGVAEAAVKTMKISLEPVVKMVFEQEEKKSPLSQVITGYTSMLRQFASLKENSQARTPWPIICIDEANVLTEWDLGSEEQQRDLRSLLRFFVRVTKQERQAHVVLATSDYSFLDWLSRGISTNFYKVHVIGDFVEDEARTFFHSSVLPSCGISLQPSDEEWQLVYQVAGGNPGLLINAAAEFKGDWKESLASVWSPVLPDLISALSTDSDMHWTPSQFAALAERLLTAPHNAVTVIEAQKCLGPNGKRVLQALVKANLLAYRPFSAWARDLPPEVHINPGQEKAQPVVTAPSAAHLYCMRLLQKDGDLDRAKSPANAAASPLGEELRLAGDALRVLEADIKAVVEEIEYLRKKKPEFWREDLAALRKREEQLRKEKEQLRDEKKQLLDILRNE